VVLDDDEVILDLLGTLIAEAGHHRIAAPRLEDLPPDADADLVITDLVPLTSYCREPSLSWIAMLRKRFPAAPIVVVTAHPAALAEPDKLGANEIVGKPFDVDALLAKVEALLPGRS
jgi:DNA-binding response OmpR family regulator